MDLTLNEFQTMLQTSAREFMEDQVPKSRVLEIDDSESGFDPNLWEQMSELGMAVSDSSRRVRRTRPGLGRSRRRLGGHGVLRVSQSAAVFCGAVRPGGAGGGI